MPAGPSRPPRPRAGAARRSSRRLRRLPNRPATATPPWGGRPGSVLQRLDADAGELLAGGGQQHAIAGQRDAWFHLKQHPPEPSHPHEVLAQQSCCGAVSRHGAFCPVSHSPIGPRVGPGRIRQPGERGELRGPASAEPGAAARTPGTVRVARRPARRRCAAPSRLCAVRGVAPLPRSAATPPRGAGTYRGRREFRRVTRNARPPQQAVARAEIPPFQPSHTRPTCTLHLRAPAPVAPG